MGLDIVELFIEVERVFEVSIPDADASELETVGSLYDYLCIHSPLVGARRAPGDYSGPLWNRFVQIVASATGVEVSQLRPEARFVQDLGMD
jgi:acyl carrier protein